MEITEIITRVLPAVLLAVLTSALATVSTQGFKSFLQIEIEGDSVRALLLFIVIIWSYILVIHYGGGEWSDFGLNIVLTLMGATGIYETLMKNSGDGV